MHTLEAVRAHEEAGRDQACNAVVQNGAWVEENGRREGRASQRAGKVARSEVGAASKSAHALSMRDQNGPGHAVRVRVLVREWVLGVRVIARCARRSGGGDFVRMRAMRKVVSTYAIIEHDTPGRKYKLTLCVCEQQGRDRSDAAHRYARPRTYRFAVATVTASIFDGFF